MKLATFLIALMAVGSALANEAAPLEAKAWTPASLEQALQARPQGNSERGKQLHHSAMCIACHGAAGVAPTRNWPSVAGQKADYTYKTLLDYQSGLRAEDERAKLMTASVKDLSAQDLADIASYYASLPLPASLNNVKQTVPSLVRSGDPTRLITPCASCHGVKGQGGKFAAPALAGQTRLSFIRTMDLYRSGARHNDVNQVMTAIARQLSATEIKLLADYYAAH
ncbi:MAG: c-type cytochrome [Thiofilum sp.]|uniref:c-type cytochrome n=1 Tax=Thiofilum sp. TaxID=2212733 RepID=UPI0025F786ED|nr:c-type cytochrome [Thiofilum sp.]MBK8454375.1 c-type cytochrome [Thiofilum sp.]